jgi:hypothetical protein
VGLKKRKDHAPPASVIVNGLVEHVSLNMLDSAGVSSILDSMSEITIGSDGEFTCDCGAVYRVQWIRTPVPNTGIADCEWCGMLIESWQNQTTRPSYELVKRPE